MNKKELMESIDQAYKALQMLDLKPTKGNMGILMNVMAAFENAYGYLNSEGAPEVEDGAE